MARGESAHRGPGRTQVVPMAPARGRTAFAGQRDTSRLEGEDVQFHLIGVEAVGAAAGEVLTTGTITRVSRRLL